MNWLISKLRFQTGPVAGRHGLAIGPCPSAIGNARAFSLVEVIIVVSLLSVIVLGLVAMFGQTQRAFRLGMTQTDVLEGGRTATDLIRREIEQVTPSYQPASVLNRPQPNFYFSESLTPAQTLAQPLPGSSARRTNFLGDVFFLTRHNQDWVGIGYFVQASRPQANSPTRPLVGALYRFETNAPVLSGRTPAQMFQEFRATTANPYRASKILDGVIHFYVRTYNTNGFWIVSDQDVSAGGTQGNTFIGAEPGKGGRWFFYSNAVPASVELELGILEDRAWERYKSLPDPASQYRYLTNQAGRVHLFRQRISIRNVDPEAYR